MKICHVFSKFEKGGAEFNAIYLAQAAKKSGNDVQFIIGETGTAKEILETEGINYSIVPMQSSFNPFKVARSVFKLKSYFVKERVEIVHAHMLREQSLCLGAKFLGAKVKVVRSVHRLDQYNFKMKPLLWFYNWQTDAYIAVSAFLKQNLNWVNKKKLFVIENGVSAVKVTRHGKAVGTLGRLYSEKGVYDFVKNADPKERLIVGGYGPELQKIKELKKDNVEIYGEVKDKKEFFSKISVLLLPSRTEVMPLSVIEAFSAGVPVIAFDIPALRDLITRDNGVLVPSFDNKKMAEVAANLLSDDTRLSQLSVGAQKTYSKNYTVEHMWNKAEKLYKSLLA